MKNKKVAVMLCLVSCGIAFAKEEGNVQVNPHWEDYHFKVFGSYMIGETHTFSRNFLKENSREKIMSKVSLFLENVLVDQDTKIKDILKSNSSFAREYSIFLNSLYLERFFIRRNRSFARMSIPLRGNNSLLSTLPLPWGDLNYQDLKKSKYVGQAYYIKDAKSSVKKSPVPIKYTGLIIDMRDYDFQPSLSPRIYSRSGKLIYGAEFIHPKIGVRRGVAGFSKNLDTNETIRRAGQKPMFLVALGVSGKFNTNAVISHEDQQEFFSHEESVKNLLKCRVIFIID